MTFRLWTVPAADEAWLAPVFDRIADIERAEQLRLFGHDDLCGSGDRLRQGYRMQDDHKLVLIVATDEPDDPADPAPRSPAELTGAPASASVVGSGLLTMPVRDNVTTAELEICVKEDHRGRGLGSSLLRALEDVARAHGRTRLTAWSTHLTEAEPGAPDALVPPTGAGRLAAGDPAVRLAHRLGYTLQQTERYSVLELPVASGLLDELGTAARRRSAGYHTTGWAGRTPAEFVEAMAELKRRMSTDVPMGGLDFEEEVWDAARIRRTDDRREAMGRTTFVTVARETATGRLAGYTEIMTSPDHPRAAWQNDTLVHADHRGRRLGQLIKVANLERLRDARPEVRRVHTWNAGENRWMLAINVALGFRRAATQGAWLKRLD